jgi:GGDEF domain-containing protein
VRTGASVGFAVYPNDGSDMNDMLNLADQSMYDCKSSGMMVLS